MRGGILFDGIRISCGDIDGLTGATLIHFGTIKPTCVIDPRGGWVGHLTSLSNNDKNQIDGICIVGGSMLGFEAGAGVVSSIWKEHHKIASIEQACIFSRNLEYDDERGNVYPTRELGEQLYSNLKSYLSGNENGQVGAGTTARYGQAILQKKIGGYNFLCCVVNNAVGEVTIGSEPNAKKTKRYSNERKATTITTLVTNMQMDYFELKQICIQMHASMSRTIVPFNTFQDGDVFYMCSTQTKKKSQTEGADITDFYIKVEEFIEETIKRTV